MKYCKSCGAELVDDAVVCPKCGVAVGEMQTERKNNMLGVVGFVLSFFTGPIGFIVSLIGLIQGKKNGEKVGFAIAGLILSSIEIVFAIILYSIILGAAFSGVDMLVPLTLL